MYQLWLTHHVLSWIKSHWPTTNVKLKTQDITVVYDDVDMIRYDTGSRPNVNPFVFILLYLYPSYFGFVCWGSLANYSVLFTNNWKFVEQCYNCRGGCGCCSMKMSTTVWKTLKEAKMTKYWTQLQYLQCKVPLMMCIMPTCYWHFLDVTLSFCSLKKRTMPVGTLLIMCRLSLFVPGLCY